MSDPRGSNRALAIQIEGAAKLYKLYGNRRDKILDAFGLSRFRWSRKSYYQEFWALRDLNLIVKGGERVGVIGRNGAGKSTLLKLIAGTISPTEGKITVKGRVQALLELGTGFHPEFTGRENIRASLAYQGLSDSVIRTKEQEIIEFAEIDEFIDQPIKTYSSGMGARLAFSTATAVEPEILIVDEILGAGDAYFAGKCVERMRRITEDSGATVLFVSHDMGSIQRLCARTIWIDRGRVRMEGDTLEVIKEYQAMVREQEAARLHARDLRKRQVNRELVETRDEGGGYERLSFRLVGANAYPSGGRQRISGVALFQGDKELARIDIGGPMDNSVDYANHILDLPGCMDWGPTQRDGDGGFREYGNFGGTYQHAPFELAVPRHALRGAVDLRLEVKGRFDPALATFVERHTPTGYERLGQLGGGVQSSLPLHLSGDGGVDEVAHVVGPTDPRTGPKQGTLEPEAEAAAAGSVRDRRRTADAEIHDVKFLDRHGAEQKVFSLSEPLATAVVDFELTRPRSDLVIALLVFREDGVTVSTFAYRVRFDPPRAGACRAEIDLAALPLASGKFTCSVGIYDELNTLDNTREQPVLAHWDRVSSFSVDEVLKYRLPKGVVAPRATLTVFDRAAGAGPIACDVENLIY